MRTRVDPLAPALNPASRHSTTDSYFWAVAWTLIVAWFLYFAGEGLYAPFTSDDLTNLHKYMQKSWVTLLTDNVWYWSAAYRPMGGLFYVGLYEQFGLEPLPFRVVCFTLMLLNLALLFTFTRRISRSGEVALFATFLLSYHAWFVDLYFSSGTVYDLLCFSFYFAAFTLYIRVRQDDRSPGWRESFAIAALYICALNAKEMAVTLPLFLWIYEATFHSAGPLSARAALAWCRYGGRTGLILGLLTLPYVVGKLTGAGSLVENPAYQVSISPGRFLDTFHLYLNPFLYQDHLFRDSNTVQMLIAMLAFALWRRSRPMIFSWHFLLLGILPVAFINHYSAFFLYIPSVGWGIYAGEMLSLIRRGISNLLPRREPVLAISVILATVALALAPLHLRERAKTRRLFESVQPPSRDIAEQMLKQQPALKPGARVVFVNDPFAKDPYFLLFLVRLLYRDMTVEVLRTAVQPVAPAEYGQYDAVFVFNSSTAGGSITMTRWRLASKL